MSTPSSEEQKDPRSEEEGPGPSTQEDPGAGATQQAGAIQDDNSPTVPEDVWLPFIKSMYPDLHGQTYFLPPLHFRQTPHTVETFADETVLVVDNPTCMTRKSRSSEYSPPPQPVEGKVYNPIPSELKEIRVQMSDLQGDTALERCLQALKEIHSQVMMVLIQLKFRKYLDNKSNPERKTNPLHAAAIAQLPTTRDKTIPEKIADGECDILIIHRHHGMVVGEVKSVGYQSERTKFFSSSPPSDQNQAIVKKLLEAVTQLTSQETALKHLVSDMDPIRITKTILLPNITSAQLQEAVDISANLAQALCQCLSCYDVPQVVGKCLCVDQLDNPLTWWETLLTEGPDQYMSPRIYDRLVARFCGPATTVEVPTVTPPRLVVRSQDQAIAETGFRFSLLALTPRQMDLLNREFNPKLPEKSCGVYLQGPPGCGKTVVLFLKALHWAQQGKTVHIVCLRLRGIAVSVLLEKQLKESLGAASASSIRRHCFDFEKKPEDVGNAVSRLVNLAPANGETLYLIVDEVGFHIRNQFFQFLQELTSQVSSVTVWTAGLWGFVKELTVPPPKWLSVEILTEPLRCPPVVTREVQQSGWFGKEDIPDYCDPTQPAWTEGWTVKKLLHKGQPGHSKNHPLGCTSCADIIAEILEHEMHVGQRSDHSSLTYKDAWILCDKEPSCSNAMIRHLEDHHGLPIRVVTQPLSKPDAQELAQAITDQVIVTNGENVQGLERTVVIGMSGGHYERYAFMSRATGALYYIDPPAPTMPR